MGVSIEYVFTQLGTSIKTRIETTDWPSYVDYLGLAQLGTSIKTRIETRKVGLLLFELYPLN